MAVVDWAHVAVVQAAVAYWARYAAWAAVEIDAACWRRTVVEDVAAVDIVNYEVGIVNYVVEVVHDQS